MAKSKVTASNTSPFVKGGGKAMFGKQSAGSKNPFVTGKSDKAVAGQKASAGGKAMFGKQSASPRASGKTGK